MAAQAVSSEVSCLPTFEAGIIGCALGRSSGCCIRSELSVSLILSTPISIEGAGTIQIYWNGLIGHPPRCIGRIELWPSLSSTLGTEAWTTLLVKEVSLSSLVAAEESWPSPLEGLIWLVYWLLEVVASLIEVSSAGSSSSFKNALDQHPGSSDLNGFVFKSLVVCWDRGYKYSFHDISRESFDE